MPRYYFDIEGDIEEPDQDGLPLADETQAKKVAVETVIEIARISPRYGDFDVVAIVRDEAGRRLLKASLLITVES